jgi:hypothetical protein
MYVGFEASAGCHRRHSGIRFSLMYVGFEASAGCHRRHSKRSKSLEIRHRSVESGY